MSRIRFPCYHCGRELMVKRVEFSREITKVYGYSSRIPTDLSCGEPMLLIELECAHDGTRSSISAHGERMRSTYELAIESFQEAFR